MSKELIDRILKASEEIHKHSLKGSANYIVSSPVLAKIFEEKLKCNIRKTKIKKIFNEEI